MDLLIKTIASSYKAYQELVKRKKEGFVELDATTIRNITSTLNIKKLTPVHCEAKTITRTLESGTLISEETLKRETYKKADGTALQKADLVYGRYNDWGKHYVFLKQPVEVSFEIIAKRYAIDDVINLAKQTFKERFKERVVKDAIIDKRTELTKNIQDTKLLYDLLIFNLEVVNEPDGR